MKHFPPPAEGVSIGPQRSVCIISSNSYALELDVGNRNLFCLASQQGLQTESFSLFDIFIPSSQTS